MNSLFSKEIIILFALLFLAHAGNTQMNVIPVSLQTEPVEEAPVSSNPIPDHIVILILENHSYLQVMGSRDAPYINSISKDTLSSVFTRSYIFEHPSQPNYLDLYSGSNQWVTDDSHPENEPFTTPNLGRQLMDAGKSFATYSEDLPAVGFNGDQYRAYVRKHNPATNWMGTGKNQIPANTNQPFTAFPSDFSKLPTVSLVVPNQINDMHDGSVSTGDGWVRTHLDSYIQWAKTHNSLLIITFDEDDFGPSQHILTIFTGGIIKGGENKFSINHYNVLRTVEWLCGLPYAGNAEHVKTIDNCWR